MPVSTERHSGFSVSKWELKYLRCRYAAHRNKIAAAKPAIDAKAPPERPHVRYKKKKALDEERRQVRVVQENLRLLDRTMNIMASTDMPTQFSKARSTSSSNLSSPYSLHQLQHPPNNPSLTRTSSLRDVEKCSSLSSASTSKRQNKYDERPLTARLKRNTHIIFHWFIQRFGKYVPWWAEINY
ncbi:unnamed protein product [Orchesella dallaii]|uniref:Uncharacterized protein n=1 Tax=Orchesella dallaii TaxID=48710 RepID=A0ABP1S2Z4_9HEXA